MGEAPGTYRKLRLLDAAGLGRAIARMAHEIVESEGGTDGFVLIGIRTRGVPLARRLAGEIERTEKVRVGVGLLDITLYRDDLSTVAASPVLKKTEIPFAVEGRTVILCDDVLFTGRTVRAAMDAILDFGRPRKILLAVLMDRGRRELPIEAQFVGKRIATSTSEIVSVTFRETDGVDDVWLLDRESTPKTPPRARRSPGSPRPSPSARRPKRRSKK
ncbi:MAG: bifunctional pyr operon transcriptional regulator/uracil phosphoribosyltransferase PyrR [Acidobacteriota bacterium]